MASRSVNVWSRPARPWFATAKIPSLSPDPHLQRESRTTMAHRSESEIIAKTHNTARFFTENRHISWVLLVGTILWGVFGYATMPKRKDPDIPVRSAVAIVSWPGATAENVEDRVTRVVEHKLAENSKIDKLESTTRAGVAVVTITLDKNVEETAKEFDDIWLKLQALTGLPSGSSMQF